MGKRSLSWDKPIPKYGTSEWRAYQYIMAKIANRGRNYRYYIDGDFERLESKGYTQLGESTKFRSVGQERVRELIEQGFHATMILVPTSIRGCPEIYIFYKHKKNSL